MWQVFLLFMIPIGGGIPAGVLLAQKYCMAWYVTAWLYFVSDLILALAFEPLLRLMVMLGRRINFLGRVMEALKTAINQITAQYGAGGPVTLIMVAFGVDPMTGRAVAAARGHGFITGWAIAITGDMLYFGVIMASTLKLNSALSNHPNIVVSIMLVAMFLFPYLLRWIKNAVVLQYGRLRA